jgi:subtilisin family serine protease
MQSGTSFAAAQVSGIAALLLERNPTLDAASIRRLLMSTARDLGAPGHDEQFGSGLANALDAVTAAGPKSSDVSSSTPAPAN